jgi:hypothetical protein
MANEIQADYASGSVLYAIVRTPAGQVWRPAGRAFEDWGAGGHAIDDYDIALTDKSGNRYVGDFDADIPAGCYCIQVFRQAGASPTDGDVLVCSRDICWTGAGEVTATKILANKAVHRRVANAVDYYDDDGVTVLLTHNLNDEEATSTRTPE